MNSASNNNCLDLFNIGSDKTDQQLQVVFDAIRQLMTPPASAQGRIGFRREGAEE